MRLVKSSMKAALCLAVLAATGFISASSLVFAAALPVLTAAIYRNSVLLLVFAVSVGLVIIVRHISNIRLLAAGTEPLAHHTPAGTRRPRPDEAVADRIRPHAARARITGSLGPGRLAAPESLFQRSFEQRQRFIEGLGGSKESEAAVARALAYLARIQQPDGRWTFAQAGERQAGASRPNYDPALTGLAALCFLAADHTPAKPGPYQACTGRAMAFLTALQKPTGDLRGHGDMYGHAIAALALAEAATMTGDAACREAAIRAGRFILQAQHPRTGGWRYVPRDPGDTSVFGWQVMALHSAERLGAEIPEPARKLALGWLNRVSQSPRKMLAGYQNANHTRPMTAEAVFSRILLGQQLSAADQKEACDFLMGLPPGKGQPNFYYYYYGSLALMQMQNAAWQQWNAKMRDLLVRLQRRGGTLDGSWDPRHPLDRRGGRIYTTALAALTLEVYYRYLPMYVTGK